MNILTFDIEEWFHILDNNQTKGPRDWSKFEKRIDKNMDIIFEIIDNCNVSATFFVVGWIADKYPKIIKEISKRGYEIGSHTHLHQLMYNMNKKKLHEDVKRSILTIEDCVGKKVKSFRAPGFSITKKNKWAFEILFELGIEIDCSIFPASRAHGGMSKYKESKPSIISYNGVKIKEFPINTFNILNKPIIFSGGGYFRLMPYKFIKLFTQNSDYTMTYFHPRDFDKDQPMIPGLSPYRRFKSYVGINGCKEKLEKWLSDFDFIDLDSANKIIDWNEVPVIRL